MEVGTCQTNLSQLQSAKALMYDALAGLLTYSPPPGLPIRWLTDSDHSEWTLVFGAYSCGTVPDSHRSSLLIPIVSPGTKSGAKLNNFN